MGATLRLGRKRIPVEEGDTIGSALYRGGIRTFSRSLMESSSMPFGPSLSHRSPMCVKPAR